MATTRLQRYASGKTLDEAARELRVQKAIDNLEKDNHHDDPHRSMKIMKKPTKVKVIQLDSTTTEEDSDDSDEPKKSRRKKKTKKAKRKRSPTPEYSSIKRREDIEALIRVQKRDNPQGPNYVSATAGPSKFPARNFCSVCGFPCEYRCATCGAKFCSTKCMETHKETRCMKFVV